MNSILYKYRDWKNDFHRKSFIDSTIFFASNLKFNDCFDLQLPVKFKGTIEFDVTSLINDAGRSLTQEEIHEANYEWPRIVENNPGILEERITEYENAISIIEGDLGVYCLCKNGQNVIMWGHYATSYSGFVIGFNEEKLRNHLQQYGHQFQFYDVDYIIDFPELDLSRSGNNDYLLKIAGTRFASKHIGWEYEDELRIIGNGFKDKPLKIPEAIVDKIIVGYKIDDHDSRAISILAQKIYPSAKIYKASPSKESFQMELTELEN